MLQLRPLIFRDVTCYWLPTLVPSLGFQYSLITLQLIFWFSMVTLVFKTTNVPTFTITTIVTDVTTVHCLLWLYKCTRRALFCGHFLSFCTLCFQFLSCHDTVTSHILNMIFYVILSELFVLSTLFNKELTYGIHLHYTFVSLSDILCKPHKDRSGL